MLKNSYSEDVSAVFFRPLKPLAEMSIPSLMTTLLLMYGLSGVMQKFRSDPYDTPNCSFVNTEYIAATEPK